MTPVAEPDKQRQETSVNYPIFLSDGQRYLVRATAAGPSSIQLGTLGSTVRSLVLDGVESAPLLAWSPGGRSYLLVLRGPDVIAYDFDEASGTTRGEPVVLVSNVGLVASPTIRPTIGVSPGLLAYQSGGDSLIRQLAWVDRSGADVETLPAEASVQLAQASPDGRLVAGSRFDSATSSNLWVTDLRRRSSTRVTFSGFARETVWAPDSARLAFRRAPIGGSPGMYVIGIDGANERQLTATNGRPTSWSSDGRYILYDVDGKLMMVGSADGEDPVEVGSPNGRSKLGVFSPDVKYIAYDSYESGRWEVYVRAMPPATQRVKVSISGGQGPHWRRDGKELYFLSAENAVMAVDVTTGDSFSAGTPRELFKTTGRDLTAIWDVNRDGSRFLLPARSTDNSPITVVLNWWVELESRLNASAK